MGLPTKLVHKWQARIDEGKVAQKKWSDTFRIADLDKYYEGHQKPSWWVDEQFIPINLIFSNVQTQLDNLTAGKPKFHVNPKRTMLFDPELHKTIEQQAKLRENTLNYIVGEENVSREIRKSL